MIGRPSKGVVGRGSLSLSQPEYRTFLELSPDAIIVHDGHAVILTNVTMVSLLGAQSVEGLVGRALFDFVAPMSQALVEERIRHMHEGDRGPLVDETWRRDDGTEMRVEVAATPMPGISPRAAMVVARDVTEQRRMQQERELLLAEKELLMREVHHRVANSLQLVQGLLILQARGTESDDVRIHLRDASARIGTISNLHSRLQKGDSAVEGDALPYLEGVIQDLRTALGDHTSREILLVQPMGEPLILEADSLVALGLITAEAVTNSIKYGLGNTRVSLERRGGQLDLAIEDDGPGFPPHFNPSDSGLGLGMRMIASLAKARGGRVTIGSLGNDEGSTSRMVVSLPLSAATF